MTVPGSNLLKRAQTVIHREEFTYYPYLSRVETDIGTLVSSYGPGVTIRDTVQPIAQSLQRQLGLPMEKVYIHIYTSSNLRALARAGSGDLIDFAGYRYEILEKNNDWIAQDGWEGLVAVQQGIAGAPP